MRKRTGKKLTSWKAIESDLASFFGTKRKILSGSNSRGSRSDSNHKRLFIECKHTAKNATISLAEETFKLALKEKKIPVVGIRLKYAGSGKRQRPGIWLVVHQDDLISVAIERLVVLERRAKHRNKYKHLIDRMRKQLTPKTRTG